MTAAIISFVIRVIFEIIKACFTNGNQQNTANEAQDNRQLVDTLHRSVRDYELRYGRPDDLRSRRDPGAPAPIHQRR
jgi:hypothetical protein